MPKVAKELSLRAVSGLREDGRYAVGGVAGLHLRVSAGHRGWVLRIKVGEARRDIGLGAYPGIGLAEAREKAREIHKLAKVGTDPLHLRKQQRSAILTQQASDKTFDWCVDAFIKAKAEEWRNPKHRQQWENTLASYCSPKLGKFAVRDIDLQHVLACLEPIWRTKNETASRLRGRIESVLDWATVRRYRTGDNPARWKGHLDKVLLAPSKIQKVKHHAAVPIDQMQAFITLLKTRDGYAARALEFAILTAARSGEVRGAKWAELDLDSGVWTVPAERMKAKKEHRVPLSKVVTELLQALPRIHGCNLVFPGNKGQPLSDMSLTAVMRRMEVRAVPHGFRSTFRDWAGDRTQYARDLAEAALAHTLGNKTEEAYRRSDALEKRRQMMEDWANFIFDLQLPAPLN